MLYQLCMLERHAAGVTGHKLWRDISCEYVWQDVGYRDAPASKIYRHLEKTQAFFEETVYLVLKLLDPLGQVLLPVLLLLDLVLDVLGVLLALHGLRQYVHNYLI